MEKRHILGIMFLLLVIGVSGLSLHIQPTRAERWIPCVPDPREVDLDFWLVNETAHVKVVITFPVIALNVSDWGIVLRKNSDFWVDSEVWFLVTDAYLPMVQVIPRTYDLGYLKSGTYTFTFKTWGTPVKSVIFSIPANDPSRSRGLGGSPLYFLI